MKNVFNVEVINLVAQHIAEQQVSFDRDKFLVVATDDIENRELKDRANQICLALKVTLPQDFPAALDILLASLQPEIDNMDLQNVTTDESGVAGWIILPYSQYVGELGQNHLELSLSALKTMTRLFSSEFGIRYFLINHESQTLEILKSWLNDPCCHVRRLISEGTRPLLPWAMQLTELKQTPDLVLPLLTKLRDDDSEYVRRSVANHLNDISKNHPDWIAKVVEDWYENTNQKRQKLLKHASRTLIKQGNRSVLAVFGFHQVSSLKVSLKLDKSRLNLGESISLRLMVNNQSAVNNNLLIDYVIHHQKANGQLTPKVFKWKTLNLKSGQTIELNKLHSIKPITTRKYYPGEHKVAVLINGQQFESQSFKLHLSE